MSTTNTVSLQFPWCCRDRYRIKYLLKTPSISIMIDCGLFQGLRHVAIKES